MLINYNFILKIITISSRHTIKICLIKQIERNAMARAWDFPAIYCMHCIVDVSTIFIVSPAWSLRCCVTDCWPWYCETPSCVYCCQLSVICVKTSSFVITMEPPGSQLQFDACHVWVDIYILFGHSAFVNSSFQVKVTFWDSVNEWLRMILCLKLGTLSDLIIWIWS